MIFEIATISFRDILYTPDDPGFWDHVFKVQHNFQDSTFADFLTHHVDETDLPRLIISNLKTTCDGVLACIKSGKRLTWTLGELYSANVAFIYSLA